MIRVLPGTPAGPPSITRTRHPVTSKLLTVLLLLACSGLAAGRPVPGSIDVRWHEGARNCDAEAWEPLQVHAYEAATFVIRQHPCAHFEANFVYLLVGSERALLIDTGAVAEPERMPLADTVMGLLPTRNGAPMPLLVVHSHGHRDHRSGDAQFASLPSVRIVPTGDGMRGFFGFDDWPRGHATIDLGDRTVHVVPAPGHHPDHLVFHDDRTALLFTGDFLLPGRLLVDDLAAYRESVDRIIRFVGGRPVSHVLGGHLELDAKDQPYPRSATHRPDQRPLAMEKADLLALAAALEDFNGFYARHPRFIFSNPMNSLLVLSALVLAAIAGVVWGVVWFSRKRRGRFRSVARFHQGRAR